jgi:glycosyltransferase involved in cell wall biosynthesis
MGRYLTAKLASGITGTSDAVMNDYGYDKGMFKKKRKAPAYCGIDTERFSFDQTARKNIRAELDWGDENKVILFAGRIGLHEYDKGQNEKNPAFAFEIAKESIAMDNSYRFMFAGFKGRLGEQMETEVLNTLLADKIKFLGIRKDMPALMSAADVLLFPSKWEGLGMVATEAQASGLKVLASDTVPTEAFVINGLITRKSLSSAAGDWVQELVKMTCTTNTERKAFNEEMKRSVFSIGNSVTDLLKLYHQ